MKSSRNKLEEHLGNEQQLATGLLCDLHVCVVKPVQMPLQTKAAVEVRGRTRAG
jgi:hypothetical protein